MVNIRISVRALVEHLLKRGDLSMSFDIASRIAMFASNHAHQKIQKSRTQPYETEVPVFYHVENERIALDIQGQIDGVYELADSVVIPPAKISTVLLNNTTNFTGPRSKCMRRFIRSRTTWNISSPS